MGGRSWGRIEEDRIIRLVSKCKDARQLKQIHAHVVVNGQSQNSFLNTKFIREFTAFGDLRHARAVIDSIQCPNVYLWTAMIRGYSKQSNSQSCCREAVVIYAQMHRRIGSAMARDQALTFALSSVLKACTLLVTLKQGMQIHNNVVKYGCDEEIRIQTSLIDFYAKCGLAKEARQVFDRMTIRDIQAWNTMIAGYAFVGNMDAAGSLFQVMPERNLFTWEVMLTGYAKVDEMDYARELFDDMCSCRLQMSVNVVIYTAMITGYAKCGDVLAARSLFDGMVERDAATWNAMISAYSKVGFFDEAVDLFRLMLKMGRDVKPNHTTIASVVAACAQSGSIKLAQWIKDYINSRGSELLNTHTVTALIDMHAKCGDPDMAYEVFKSWKDKDVVCYSSMISGFGMHGRGMEALKIFSQLKEDGLNPDSVCFIVVLSACSHAGLIDEGKQYFKSMQNDYSITPTADHYMCLVDLLGRAGHILEAYGIIVDVMPPVKPHAGVWGSLLSACRVYNNVEIGEVAGKHLLEIEPNNAGNYVLLSNIYAKAHMWDEVAKVRALMRERGMKKPPGASWIEFNGKTHKFLTSDVQDHHMEIIMQVLALELKAQGYLPGMDHED
ncbi:putative pentatricopeptide repeat-containing protein At5g37570 [Telopea speciosissima]|uniref:putative pentatricopeptide repeat-containing protein At5g37570 n=1 Tax=Telopea speciosissima TaxID=54955 RepID=UPI001CC6209A|nr:putative pentatricopeptide repeat-containing protein At5g37570 [Telopea speciosissima]